MVGLQLPSFTWPGGAPDIRLRLADIARQADELGFHSLWVMDHLFQLPPETGWNGPDQPMLEAYSTLGYLAGATSRVRLGALVTCVVYRPPGLLAKQVTALDVLSGGRAYASLGAGWYEAEARGLGLPFPSRRERFERVEEAAIIIRNMLGGAAGTFEGQHYRLEMMLNNPAPLHRVPLMIGGSGERTTLRLVARLADACNILVPEPGESRRKLQVLRRHCEDVGRDYGEIETTSLLEIDMRRGAPAVLESLQEQHREGIEHVIVNLPNAHEPATLERLAKEVVAPLRD